MRNLIDIVLLQQIGRIHVALFSDDALHMEMQSKSTFWLQRNFYGVDISSLYPHSVNDYFSQVSKHTTHRSSTSTCSQFCCNRIHTPWNQVPATYSLDNPLLCKEPLQLSWLLWLWLLVKIGCSGHFRITSGPIASNSVSPDHTLLLSDASLS